MTQTARRRVVVGVLALQGAFNEHTQLLKKAFAALADAEIAWDCAEVRNPAQLAACDALIIPGGESTAIAHVAASSGLLEPLRSFVKAERKPVWGTCAGMILLAEAANKTKQGGQELIGGLDVRVRRNFFGRQVESFEADLSLPFLASTPDAAGSGNNPKFRGVFIRAPVVERLLTAQEGAQDAEEQVPDTVVAPSRAPMEPVPASAAVGHSVEVLATLPGRGQIAQQYGAGSHPGGDIVAVRQANVIATSFHPELTEDARIHLWWLSQEFPSFSRRFRSLLLSDICSPSVPCAAQTVLEHYEVVQTMELADTEDSFGKSLHNTELSARIIRTLCGSGRLDCRELKAASDECFRR